MTVEELSPQTSVCYRVVNDSHASQGAMFRTAPHRDTPFRFAVWVDSQTAPPPFETLLDQMIANRVDFAVGVGDMATDGGVYDDVHNYQTPLRFTA